MKLLIKDVTLEKDKNDVPYKRVTVVNLTPVSFEGRDTMSRGQESTKNWFPERVVDGFEADGITPKKSTIKATNGFDSLSAGQIIDGGVKTLKTTPYSIDGRIVEQYTCVHIGNEDPIKVALRNLNNGERKDIKVFNDETKMFVGLTNITEDANQEAAKQTADMN